MRELIERLKAYRLYVEKTHSELSSIIQLSKSDVDGHSGPLHLLLSDAITALEAFQWIPVSERLPEIDYTQPEYSWSVNVMTSDGKHVRQLRYISNGYAVTAKGRLPRFEEISGKLAYTTPTHWMPLPAPPKAD